MQNNAYTDLTGLLYNTHVWSYDDGQFYVTHGVHSQRPSAAHCFSHEQLTACHRLFPYALRGALAWSKKNLDKSYVYGSIAGATLNYLKCPIDFYNERFLTISVSRVLELEETDDKELIRIHATTLEVEELVVKGETVPFVYHCANHWHTITREQLDKHFSDWSERWKIGKDLGLESLELSQLVFTQVTEPSEGTLPQGLVFE